MTKCNFDHFYEKKILIRNLKNKQGVFTRDFVQMKQKIETLISSALEKKLKTWTKFSQQ